MTTLVGIIVVATLAATARAGTTIDEFRLKQDERLAARWAENNVDGVLDGVEEIQLRLPQEPLAQLWLSVVIAAEGMPETGMAVGAAPSRTLASSQGARVLEEQRKTALRTIEFTVAAEENAPLAAADKAALERGVRAWLAQWTPQPEAQPTSPSPRLGRALALLGTTPPGKALVTVAWQGPVLGVRAIGGARTATLPELGIRVGSFAPMVVGAKDLLAAKAPLPLRLQRPVRAMLSGMLGFGLIAVPGAFAVVGLGLVGGGAVFYGRAEEAAAAYAQASTRPAAVNQRDQVEARVGLANLLTQVGVTSAGLAVVASALPALWLLVWNPDSPAPPDFPTE